MANNLGETAIPNHTIPAYVLAHPDCPPAIREAFLAIDAANEATAALRAKYYEIEAEAAASKAAYLQAARDGKRLPTLVPPEITDERLRAKDMEVRRSIRRAVDVATTYEKLLPVHAPAVRAILVDLLPKHRDEAARQLAEARAATAQARATADAIRSLDHIAALNVSWAAHDNILRWYYDRVNRHDGLINSHGRRDRLAASWADVEAAGTGMPVDILVQGYTGPDREQYRLEPLGVVTDETRRKVLIARAQQQREMNR